MKLPNLTTIIESVVIFIAAGSFIISYNNLHESALQMGIPPLLAIVFPLTIDFFLFAATLTILYAGQKCGDRAVSLVREGWSFLIIYTVASIAFNVHMAPADWWSRAGFAMCPIGLCIALHFLMRILEIEMGGCEVKIEEVKEEIKPEVKIEEMPIEPVKTNKNFERVKEYFEMNPEATYTEAVSALNLTYKTIRNHREKIQPLPIVSDE